MRILRDAVIRYGVLGLYEVFQDGAGHGIHAQQAASLMAEIRGLITEEDEGLISDDDDTQGVPMETPAPAPTQGAPPASKSTLQNLPMMTVAKVDIEADGNDSCCVCMEEHELGQKATKLSCGHIFHKACISSWLEQRCTCPICRFEMPTDDADFEKDRRMRMAGRKRRYRKSELEAKSVEALEAVMREIGITPPTGALTKSEFMKVLLESEFVQVQSDAPPRDMTRKQLESMSAKELRELMAELGVATKERLKARMIRRLEESGRINIVSMVPEKTPSPQGHVAQPASCLTCHECTPEESVCAPEGGEVKAVELSDGSVRPKSNSECTCGPTTCYHPWTSDELDDIISGAKLAPSAVARSVSISSARMRRRYHPYARRRPLDGRIASSDDV